MITNLRMELFQALMAVLTSAAFNLVIRVLALLDVIVVTELLPPRLHQETHRQKNLPTINFPPRASPSPGLSFLLAQTVFKNLI